MSDNTESARGEQIDSKGKKLRLTQDINSLSSREMQYVH